jgi:protein TonB
MPSVEPPFDPRSPVQPGRSAAPTLILASVAAIAVWTAWQTWPDWSARIAETYAALHSPHARSETAAPSANAASRPADQPLVGLFTADDYPPDAADRNEQGTTQVAITVGVDGRVHGCSVVVSSGSSSLDRATCRIIAQRARFRPAQDRDGNPVTGTFRQSVTWRLEG